MDFGCLRWTRIHNDMMLLVLSCECFAAVREVVKLLHDQLLFHVNTPRAL